MFCSWLVTEMYDHSLKDAMKFYRSGADMPFNFNLVYIKQDTPASDIAQEVERWLHHMPAGKWPNWVVRGNFVPPATQGVSTSETN